MSAVAVGNTVLDAELCIVSVGNQAVRVRKPCALLLGMLMRHPGAMQTNERLLDALWGDRDDGPEPRIVNVYISWLRRDLRKIGSDCRIDVVWGDGFVLRASGVKRHVHVWNSDQEQIFRALIAQQAPQVQKALLP